MAQQLISPGSFKASASLLRAPDDVVDVLERVLEALDAVVQHVVAQEADGEGGARHQREERQAAPHRPRLPLLRALDGRGRRILKIGYLQLQSAPRGSCLQSTFQQQDRSQTLLYKC